MQDKEYMKQYYETNKDKIKEYHKKYYEEHKEQIKQKYCERKLKNMINKNNITEI